MAFGKALAKVWPEKKVNFTVKPDAREEQDVGQTSGLMVLAQ